MGEYIYWSAIWVAAIALIWIMRVIVIAPLIEEVRKLREDTGRLGHLRMSESRMIEQAVEANRLLRAMALQAGVDPNLVAGRGDEFQINSERRASHRDESDRG